MRDAKNLIQVLRERIDERADLVAGIRTSNLIRNDQDDSSGRLDDTQGIQSVEIGLGVFDVLIEGRGPMALGAIAKGAGISSSQARRYLVSLIRRGLAQQDARTGLYDIGPDALRIGLVALSRVDIIESAAEELRLLSLQTGENGILCIWGDHGATAVRWFRGKSLGLLSVSLGTVFSLYASATGRVFLAHLPPEVTGPFLVNELGQAAHSPDMQQDVEKIRATVRKRGYASMTGHLMLHIRGLAAPILDADGQILATLALAGPSYGSKVSTDPAIKLLLAAAQRVSAMLGYVPPDSKD